MNASCLDEKGRFKSCPYRVYTDEEFDALVKKAIAEYDPYWKPCIILNVDN